MAKSFGAEEVAAASYSGLGQKLLPHRPDPQSDHRRSGLGVHRPRRSATRRASSRSPPIACTFLLTAGLAGAWVTSYARNRASDRTRPTTRLPNTVDAAGPLAQQTGIERPRFCQGPAARCTGCAICRPAMPRASTSAPLLSSFGLNQRERLQSASEDAYQIATRTHVPLAPDLPLEEVHRGQPRRSEITSMTR